MTQEIKTYREGQWFITVSRQSLRFRSTGYYWSAVLDGDPLCWSDQPVESEDEALLDAVNAIRLKTADLIGG